jgi:hypothetical protein
MEIKPEKRHYVLFDEENIGENMPDDVKEAARQRIAQMTDEQKETLIYLPVSGWEIERILLYDEANYIHRIGAERHASARAAELRLIRESLNKLRAELQTPSRSGAALQAVDELLVTLGETEKKLEKAETQTAHLQNELEAETPFNDAPEARFSLLEISAEMRIAPTTVSTYIGQMRRDDEKEKEKNPDYKCRIQTPKGGQLTRAEIKSLKAYASLKAPRPSIRKMKSIKVK